jgi:hypothetical protein
MSLRPQDSVFVVDCPSDGIGSFRDLRLLLVSRYLIAQGDCLFAVKPTSTLCCEYIVCSTLSTSCILKLLRDSLLYQYIIVSCVCVCVWRGAASWNNIDSYHYQPISLASLPGWLHTLQELVYLYMKVYVWQQVIKTNTIIIVTFTSLLHRSTRRLFYNDQSSIFYCITGLYHIKPQFISSFNWLVL